MTKRSTIFAAVAAAALIIAAITIWIVHQQQRKSTLDGFTAQPYEIARRLVHPNAKPTALVSPTTIKNYYNLPTTATGSGTIAIIDAYDDPSIESDLGTFSQQYGLSACTTANGCFEKHKMASRLSTSGGWALEAALDVEWAHAIAPGAKILLVEARSASGSDLVSAINYVSQRSDVVSVSMSWGGAEFSGEVNYESIFAGPNKPVFFAASGDNGHGSSWPAASAKVISVGGTSLAMTNGVVTGETAWSGSGGGVSKYILAPSWQTTYNTPQSGGYRAIPDVAYNADPNSGFPVYNSVSYYGSHGWFQVGGTSAGTPQWAAMHAISASQTPTSLYQDAAVPNQTYFRDITSGTNGTCGTQCTAQTGYDYVTGLGSPLTTNF